MSMIARTLGWFGIRELRGNPLENPAVPLSSPALWQWFTNGEPTASGETITELNALQNVTVYDCVRIIAESGASLPFEMWELTTKGRAKAVDQLVHYLLTVEPNPEMGAFTFKECMFGSCALTGNCYAQIERNGAGQPVALWPLHPLKTQPIRLEDGRLVYETSDGETLGKKRYILPDDIIHVPLFSFDGLRGLSPIQLARQALGLAKATEKFGARFFGNGTRPGGVVTSKGPKPVDKVQKEIIESWNQQHGGTNQGKTAFLFGGEWDYKQIGLSPEDSQFLATRQFQRAEIASLFRIAPHYVGDTSRLSGNNAEQQNLQFVTDTLRPYLCRFEVEFVRKLMPTVGRKANKYFVSFDVSERLRGDFKTQQEGFAAGVQWGWFNPNDVRAKLGENPGPPELDVYRVPVNMQSAKTLLEPPKPPDAPQLPGGDPPADDPPPTPAERQLLGDYTRTYIAIYRDAFGRIAHRNKRDLTVIDAAFRPVLTSIAFQSLAFNSHAEPDDRAMVDGLVDEAIKNFEKRAAKWPAPIPDGDLESYAAAEFLRCVRSIHINASREIHAARAALEVNNA